MEEATYLVDASPYVFRAFHALPSSIRDPDGRPANATYGFAGFLGRLCAEERPRRLAACFDGNLEGSFRNDWYPQYKAQRDSPPAELVRQLPDCEAMARAFGVASRIDDRYEADDLIATLARHEIAAGRSVVVVSSDKDLAQLVDERVTLLDFAKGARMGPDAVRERLGVAPGQVPDYLGLAGDPVDNIPGVRGVGPKSACRLLAEWPDLESLYADLDRVADLPVRGARSLRQKLADGRESALLSKRLATVVSDVPLDPVDLHWRGPDWSALARLAGRLGFATLVARLRRQLGEPSDAGRATRG